jgi:hypothetical protein
MKPSAPNTAYSLLRSFLGIALVFFGTSLAQADEIFPEKFRGPIVEVDLENQILVVDAAKQGRLSIPWDNESDVRSAAGIRRFSDLEVGMFVIIYMKEDRKSIGRVRHVPEEDRPTEEN